MISARRAALLGLTVPLSAIMLAVLGLWPEPEEYSPAAAAQQVYGSGKRRVPQVAERRAPPSQDELTRKVRDKWETIERVQAEDAAARLAAQAPPPVAPPAAAVPIAVSTSRHQAAPPQTPGAAPALVGLAQHGVLAALPTAAPIAAAKLAVQPIPNSDQDEDMALLLILAELV